MVVIFFLFFVLVPVTVKLCFRDFRLHKLSKFRIKMFYFSKTVVKHKKKRVYITIFLVN